MWVVIFHTEPDVGRFSSTVPDAGGNLSQFLLWVATSPTVPAVGHYLSLSSCCRWLHLPQWLLWVVTSLTVPDVSYYPSHSAWYWSLPLSQCLKMIVRCLMRVNTCLAVSVAESRKTFTSIATKLVMTRRSVLAQITQTLVHIWKWDSIR